MTDAAERRAREVGEAMWARDRASQELGMALDEVRPGYARVRMRVRPDMLNGHGSCHGGLIFALADSACGHGCQASLPDGAAGFTTVELKANYLGTVDRGELWCEARLVHGGRTTQVWDATVRADGPDGKALALFRCTQLLLQSR